MIWIPSQLRFSYFGYKKYLNGQDTMIVYSHAHGVKTILKKEKNGEESF